MSESTTMPEANATDHELILLIRSDLRYFQGQLNEVLAHSRGVGARLEAIALTEQKTDLAISTLRQDVSRAMLEASEARASASKAQSGLDMWQTRFKTLLWVGGPIAVAMGGLAQELIKRLVFP